MKKSFSILSLGLLLGMGLYSCSSADEFAPESEELVEIKLTSVINSNATRSSNIEEQNTIINKNQKVGITITGASSNHNNVQWISDGTGGLTNNGDAVYYRGSDEATIVAYHPYNENWKNVTTQSYTFNVSTNQSASIASSDLLWSTAKATNSDLPVNLTFNHLLSKINVIFVGLQNGGDSSNVKANIHIINTVTSANFTNGTVSVCDSSPSDIIAGYSTNQASAIIIPQTISAGTKLIRIHFEGEDYYLTVGEGGKTFESGKSYTYKVTLNSAHELTTAEAINPWESLGNDEFCNANTDPLEDKDGYTIERALDKLTKQTYWPESWKNMTFGSWLFTEEPGDGTFTVYNEINDWQRSLAVIVPEGIDPNEDECSEYIHSSVNMILWRFNGLGISHADWTTNPINPELRSEKTITVDFIKILNALGERDEGNFRTLYTNKTTKWVWWRGVGDNWIRITYRNYSI